MEAREPWGLNVQGAQPKGNPGAAPAGEYQKTYQILLLPHLLFSSGLLHEENHRELTPLFVIWKILSGVGNPGLLPSKLVFQTFVSGPASSLEAHSVTVLAHLEASPFLSFPFIHIPPQPCAVLLLNPLCSFFLLVGAVILLLLLLSV